jgi:kynurenine formamidase
MLIDLSHTIENEMITYKGLPAPLICDYLSRDESKKFYAEGTEFQIAKIEMVGNTGTYLDCPFHRYADGHDFSMIALEAMVDLPTIIIKVPWQETQAIDYQYFKNFDIKNKAVLVHTGWAEHWRTEQYFENHPFLTQAAAEFLVEAGAKLVGIDSHNIDDTRQNSRPVHSTLLGKGVLIVEHLCNLEQIPDNQLISFTAAPPKFKGIGTFPVRAFVRVG